MKEFRQKKLFFLDKALLGPIETSAASQKSLFVFAELRFPYGPIGFPYRPIRENSAGNVKLIDRRSLRQEFLLRRNVTQSEVSVRLGFFSTPTASASLLLVFVTFLIQLQNQSDR